MPKKLQPGTEAWLLEECKKVLEAYRTTHRVYYKKIDLVHYQAPGFPDLMVSFAPKGQVGQPIVALIELKTLHPRSSLGKGQRETIRAMRDQGMHAYVCWGLDDFVVVCKYLSQGGLPYDKPIEKPKGQGGKTLWD